METNITPHNLHELIDATVYKIDNPESTLHALLQIIKGPDFPTGGVVFGKESLRTAYATGRGGVVVRGYRRDCRRQKGPSPDRCYRNSLRAEQGKLDY